jgi:predicted ATPase
LALHRTGERYYEAELLRNWGESSLARPTPDLTTAERCLVEALETARRQQAKMVELRAATSLARPWAGQGRRGEAHDLLAPIYDRFTEGFDIADLKDARARRRGHGGLSSSTCRCGSTLTTWR